MPVLDFPNYVDGDVKLTIHPDVYRLHLNVLSTHSKVLRSLLGPPNEINPLQHIQGMDHQGAYNLNLIGEAAHKFGVPQQFTSEARGFRAVDYIPVWPVRTRRCWENIFKMFYLLPPFLHDDGPTRNILDNSWRVVELATDIEADDFILPLLGAALEGYGQELYRCISDDPIGWVNLGLRIKSVIVYQESVIHIVGRWHYLTDEGHALLSDPIREICQRKYRDLQFDKQMTDTSILNHPVDDPQNRDVYTWMAKAFYRQWLCNSIADHKTYRSLDGGAAFYRAINAGGNAYLQVVDLEAHLVLLPIEQDEVAVMEHRLGQIKDAVKHLVAYLLENRSRFNPGVWGELHYLTCCEVTQRDIPWLTDRAAQEEVALLQTMNNALPALYMDNLQFENRNVQTSQIIPPIVTERPLPSYSPKSPEGYHDCTPTQARSDVTSVVHEPDLSDDISVNSFISPPLWDEDDSTAHTESELPAVPAVESLTAGCPQNWDEGDNGLVTYPSPIFMQSPDDVKGHRDDT
ncbi:hypothetical protein AAWM_00320 [Aspergillus awamori]|uniref:BTB domain-containing protein n=1 Tax=Aspergillus awamori TaxID=105351 RepID=A0A401KDY8_ASPAW|nr:hypothetical protein AAWM_00320 [Aspergillus awamori]